MLKQKFVFAVSLIAMVTVGIGAARADIASTIYVQQGVNSAKNAASAAQTSANNANTAAVNAQDSADAAQEAADAAQASADAAAASAKTANDAVATKVTANTAITGATKAKITYDSKGLVTGGADLAASDIPTLATSKISGLDTALAAKEVTSNKVTTLSSTSTNTQYPSAKVVYDELAKKQNTLTIDSSLSSSSTNPVQNKVINTALSGKQATLSTAQLSAANSGITSAKVSTYDGYATQISAKEASANKVTSITSSSTDTQYPSAKAVYTELAKKQNTLTIDSSLSSSSTNPVQNKVINTALSGKQATLSSAQLSAANSGITSTKVSTYDGYAAQINAKEASANKVSDFANATSDDKDSDTKFPTTAFAQDMIDATVASTTNQVNTLNTKLNSLQTTVNGKQATLTTSNIKGAGSVSVGISNGVITVTGTDNDTIYTLPAATSSALGGVKIGSNITNSSGTISVATANGSTLGVVKAGTNVSISSGSVSVATGTPSTLGVVKVGQIPSGSATSETYATIWVE